MHDILRLLGIVAGVVGLFSLGLLWRAGDTAIPIVAYAENEDLPPIQPVVDATSSVGPPASLPDPPAPTLHSANAPPDAATDDVGPEVLAWRQEVGRQLAVVRDACGLPPLTLHCRGGACAYEMDMDSVWDFVEMPMRQPRIVPEIIGWALFEMPDEWSNCRMKRRRLHDGAVMRTHERPSGQGRCWSIALTGHPGAKRQGKALCQELDHRRNIQIPESIAQRP
ncbi:MAG: hypothetical protein ACI8PZ_002549 [Myxococcota bacterium]|jgi:hypothetical protein